MKIIGRDDRMPLRWSPELGAFTLTDGQGIGTRP